MNRLSTVLTVMLWLAITSPRANAQARWTPPRTADGQPDIQGTWAGPGGTSCSIETTLCPEYFTGRPADNERKVEITITDPPDRKIPYQAWAAAERREIEKRINDPVSRRGIDTLAQCFAGPPRSMFAYAYNVIQTPAYIVMMWEWSHRYRIITLNGRPPAPAGVKLQMGDARGRWEGNTLVVEATNLNDWGWFDMTGTFHSDAMTLLERFTIVDANTIAYTVTITDPRVFTRPWSLAMSIRRARSLSLAAGNATPDEFTSEPWEHACIEGERSVETMLEKRR
jgi:hypothetical protein